jgi:hypothetical protein
MAGLVEISRGIPIEVPGHEFSWESYHGTMNQSVSGGVAAPALCEALGLVNHARRLDLYERRSRPASLYRRFGEGSTAGGHCYTFDGAYCAAIFDGQTNGSSGWSGASGTSQPSLDFTISQTLVGPLGENTATFTNISL